MDGKESPQEDMKLEKSHEEMEVETTDSDKMENQQSDVTTETEKDKDSIVQSEIKEVEDATVAKDIKGGQDKMELEQPKETENVESNDDAIGMIKEDETIIEGKDDQSKKTEEDEDTQERSRSAVLLVTSEPITDGTKGDVSPTVPSEQLTETTEATGKDAEVSEKITERVETNVMETEASDLRKTTVSTELISEKPDQQDMATPDFTEPRVDTPKQGTVITEDVSQGIEQVTEKSEPTGMVTELKDAPTGESVIKLAVESVDDLIVDHMEEYIKGITETALEMAKSLEGAEGQVESVELVTETSETAEQTKNVESCYLDLKDAEINQSLIEPSEMVGSSEQIISAQDQKSESPKEMPQPTQELSEKTKVTMEPAPIEEMPEEPDRTKDTSELTKTLIAKLPEQAEQAADTMIEEAPGQVRETTESQQVKDKTVEETSVETPEVERNTETCGLTKLETITSDETDKVEEKFVEIEVQEIEMKDIGERKKEAPGEVQTIESLQLIDFETETSHKTNKLGEQIIDAHCHEKEKKDDATDKICVLAAEETSLEPDSKEHAQEKDIELEQMESNSELVVVDTEESIPAKETQLETDAKVCKEEIDELEKDEPKSEMEIIDTNESIHAVETKLETDDIESQCLEKDNDVDGAEVKNKQALESTDGLVHTQHTDSLHLMGTGENVKEIIQTEISDGNLNLDRTGKETGDFEELEPSQSWVEVPDREEEKVSEAVRESDKKLVECQEIKAAEDQMTMDLQTEDKICVGVSDTEQINIEDIVQLNKSQLEVCDSEAVPETKLEQKVEQRQQLAKESGKSKLHLN